MNVGGMSQLGHPLGMPSQFGGSRGPFNADRASDGQGFPTVDLGGGWPESDQICSAKANEGGADDEDMEDDTKDKAGAGQVPENPRQTSQVVNRPSLQSFPDSLYSDQQEEIKNTSPS
jgi:hypothetical protein